MENKHTKRHLLFNLVLLLALSLTSGCATEPRCYWDYHVSTTQLTLAEATVEVHVRLTGTVSTRSKPRAHRVYRAAPYTLGFLVTGLSEITPVTIVDVTMNSVETGKTVTIEGFNEQGTWAYSYGRKKTGDRDHVRFHSENLDIAYDVYHGAATVIIGENAEKSVSKITFELTPNYSESGGNRWRCRG